MAPPKKMSLQEFFSDESYGGSWADEEIDIASISVPIEKNRGYAYGSDSSYGSGGGRFGAGSGFGKSAFLDNGPPYIVKLSNIPVTSNDAFISDLFHSRFTPLVKFKILFDPFSHPLESGIVKKIAFVELPSFESQNKVSKWQDVVYKGSRRVTIEVADFNDFQQSMRFNQENHEELLRVETTFLSARPRFGHNDEPGPGRGRPGVGRAPGGMPLDNIPLPGSQHRFGPQLQSRKLSNGDAPHPNPSLPHAYDSAPPLNASSKPKPNPFGSAKPVDVLARQHEIERNLITSKHTIVRAPWADENKSNPNIHTQKSPDNAWGHENGPKKSLADILSNSKATDQTKNPRVSTANSTPKPIAKKPTVLMKKPLVQTPDPQEQAQENAQTEEAKTASVARKLSQASIDSELKDGSSKADLNEPAISDAKDTNLEQSTPKNEEGSNPENSTSTNTKPRPDFKKSLSEITQKSEGKKRGNRRRSEKPTDHPIDPRAEDTPPQHTLTERRPRRLSSKSRETSTRTPVSTRPPRHVGESDAQRRVEDQETNDTRNIKREPKPRRPNRRQSVDQSSDFKNAVHASTTSNDGNTAKSSTNVTAGKQASDGPSGEPPKEFDPIRRGDHRGRGRGNGHVRGRGAGRGNGRGSSRAGRGGNEVRRREGRERKEEGDKQHAAGTEKKELPKSA